MNIVTYLAPTDNMSIARRLAVKQRELDKRRQIWPAAQADDYRRWACARMANLLRHIADNLECDVSNPEIGIADAQKGGAA